MELDHIEEESRRGFGDLSAEGLVRRRVGASPHQTWITEAASVDLDLRLTNLKSSTSARLIRGELVGLDVVHEAFLDRVPGQGAAEAIADVGQMTHGRGALADLGRADGLLAVADALDPIRR